MHFRIAGPALLLLALPATAQGISCVRLGTHNQHGAYNDVWGYAAPNGKEYALLGATTGLAVIDCTDPTNPVERSFFPWATSTWRDIRTYGPYAYVSSEGAGGFQVIDLTNPDAPVSLGIIGASHFGNAHNICIDTGAGRLYMAGTNTGTPVFDVGANPLSPPYVGHALGSGNNNYFHDLCIENGYGYGSMIYNGVLRIWDMATFPPTALSNTPTPGNFTHQAWPNDAHTICVTCDEVTGGVVKFFDITNKSAPALRGQYTPNPASIPHNAFLVGNLCHVSWYTEGYQCIDFSDPNNPVRVAAWDTWPGASGGYNGCWGVYPFQPSGVVYASDRVTGLHILRPQLTTLAISHTALGSTTNEDGPYPVLATVTGNQTISNVTLHWRAGPTGAFTAVAMAPAGGNQFGANIPGQDAPTSVQYWIEAVDTVGTRRSPATTEHSFTVGSEVVLFADDFETSSGWTHGATAGIDDWQIGGSAGFAGTSGGFAWADALGAYSGVNCAGTDLGLTIAGTPHNGAYANNAATWLQSPSIATGGLLGLRLRYRRWLTLAAGDTARLLVNGIVVSTTSVATSDASWQFVEQDVSAILDGQPTATLRFELTANGSNVAGGWTIDDVQLLAIFDAAPPMHYGAATPGTGNVVPTIGLAGPAALGTTTDVLGSSLLASSSTFLVLNFTPDNTPILGIAALVQSSGAVSLFQAASAAGTTNWPFAVPNNPVFDNLYLYAQVIVADAGSPGGLLAASNGMRFRICVR